MVEPESRSWLTTHLTTGLDSRVEGETPQLCVQRGARVSRSIPIRSRSS
jgi:hypothetical protein